MSSTTKKKKKRAGVSAAKKTNRGNGKTAKSKLPAGENLVEQWQAWSRHLVERKQPQPVDRVLGSGKRSPLTWGLATEGPHAQAFELIGALYRPGSAPGSDAVSQMLESWLDQSRAAASEVSYGYQCLAWCQALPRLAVQLSAGPWWQLLERLRETSEQAIHGNEARDDLAGQLCGGELPATLAYLFPEIEGCQKLARPGLQTISRGILEATDGEGLPRASHLPIARSLLASWTRSIHLARRMQCKGLSRDAAVQLEWFMRFCIRASRFDGSAMLDANEQGGVKRLFDAALQLTGDAEDMAIADQALPARGDTRKRNSLPASDAHSEWAELAVLRSAWSRGANRLLITYGDRTLRSELCAGRHLIWSGDCQPEIAVDGVRLAPSADWEEVCWHADDDVSYVELECKLGDQWKLQRQWLLARADQFLLVADAIVGEQPVNDAIEYRGLWPLAEAVQYCGEDATREGTFQSDRPIARVVPMSLPEWRDERCGGSLQQVPGGLQLQLTGGGTGMFAPLFIDLNRRRLKKPLTWRRLTVAEKLEIQPPHVAVGYRVQVGASQWLFYRSLAQPGNRTVLGQNFSNELHIGRFTASGESEELLGVE